jgi:hypothetical protein
MAELDSKTAWELYKKVDGFAVKLAEMDTRQSLVLQEMKTEQRSSKFEMLDAVDASVEKSTRLIQSMLDGFRQEIKNMNDDHERRLTCVEDTVSVQNMAITSLQSLTHPIPEMTKNIEDMQGKAGKIALKAWQKVLAVAGALIMLVISAYIGTVFKD